MQSTVNSLHSLLLRTGSFRDTETVLWFSQREISDAYNLVNGNTSETSLWSFKRTFARFSVVQDSFCIAGVNSASSKTRNCTSVLSSGRFWVCYVLMTHPQWVVWQHFYKLNVKKIYSLVAADWSYLKWKLAGWQTLQALLHKIFRSVKVKSSWGTLKKKNQTSYILIPIQGGEASHHVWKAHSAKKKWKLTVKDWQKQFPCRKTTLCELYTTKDIIFKTYGNLWTLPHH